MCFVEFSNLFFHVVELLRIPILDILYLTVRQVDSIFLQFKNFAQQFLILLFPDFTKHSFKISSLKCVKMIQLLFEVIYIHFLPQWLFKFGFIHHILKLWIDPAFGWNRLWKLVKIIKWGTRENLCLNAFQFSERGGQLLVEVILNLVLRLLDLLYDI